MNGAGWLARRAPGGQCTSGFASATGGRGDARLPSISIAAARDGTRRFAGSDILRARRLDAPRGDPDGGPVPRCARGSRHERHAWLVQRFSWPATVWVRGYRLRLFDARGRALPRRWIHHLYVVDFDRRELVYPIAQRVFE